MTAPDPERRARRPRTPAPEVPLSATRGGRRLLNVVTAVLLTAMLISNLPDSEVKDRLTFIERPITDVTGLNQNWALFAPRPRSTTLQLRAEIERADGTVEEWTPPVGDPLVGVYRTYRWRKWAGGTVVPRRSGLHRGAATYLVAQAADDDVPVVEVRLYRGVFRQDRPGSGVPLDRDPPYEEEQLLHYRVPGTVGERSDG
jgi:hypothetical protein